MSDPAPYNLPDLRRVVTGNNERAEGIVTHNSLAPAQTMAIAKGARGTTLWVTTDGLPTNDNNTTEDGAQRPLSNDYALGMTHPQGASLRSTDLAPGAVTPMHRTSSVDYNILADPAPPSFPTFASISAFPLPSPLLPTSFLPTSTGPRPAVAGEVILLMDDGSETYLNNPGDTVIQRGAMHAWYNPSRDKWARWVSVLMGGAPAVVGGKELATEAYEIELREGKWVRKEGGNMAHGGEKILVDGREGLKATTEGVKV
ncbi:hypothetical protein EV121DRAFT_195630 [Schizophyllum commune]